MASVVAADKTVAATAAALGTSTPITSVYVVALSTNSGVAYIGGSGVTTATGFPLTTTTPAVNVICDDLADVYVIGTASDHVRYLASQES